MGYPQRFLGEGEAVVVDVRPHWWYLSRPVALVVVVIAGSITAIVETVSSWLLWVSLAVLGASLVWLACRYARWATTHLIVTTTRLIDRRGLLARRGREIPLCSLSDIGYRQSVFGRILGMGDVLLESAGRDSKEVFADLPRPAEIQNEIYRQLEAWRRPAFTAAGPTPGGPTVLDQIDQLDQLRRRGLLTDSEFEAKKSRLLDRL